MPALNASYRNGLLAVVLLAALAAAGVAVAEALPEDSLAAKGREVYLAQCAQCHGKQGEGFIGPAVIGPDARLARFGTGQRFFDYVSSTMPQSNPGGLTEQQYLQVVTYLLAANGVIAPTASPGRGELAGISLKKG